MSTGIQLRSHASACAGVPSWPSCSRFGVIRPTEGRVPPRTSCGERAAGRRAGRHVTGPAARGLAREIRPRVMVHVVFAALA